MVLLKGSWRLTDNQAADARSRAQQAEEELKKYGTDAQKKLEQARKDTGSSLSSAVDKFDKNVSEGASKSKSWIGSWIGGDSNK